MGGELHPAEHRFQRTLTRFRGESSRASADEAGDARDPDRAVRGPSCRAGLTLAFPALPRPPRGEGGGRRRKREGERRGEEE